MSPRSKSEKSTLVGPGTAVGRAERVVLLALLGFAEHVVGLLDLLEALLRGGVARIPIGVVLARELAIGLLELVGGGVLGNAECLVEGGGHAGRRARLRYSGSSAGSWGSPALTTTRAGRSTRSPSA